MAQNPKRPKAIKSKKTEPSAGNPGIAVAGADALYAIACSFISSVPQDARASADFGMVNLGGMIAASTNLTLAIELYLKGLLLTHGKAAPHTHNLPVLFAALPFNIAQSVSTAYLLQFKQALPGHPHLEIVSSSAASISSPITDYSLKALLARNSNAYEIWRYAFAGIEQLGQVRLCFEYGDLKCAAKALRVQFGPIQIREKLPSGDTILYESAPAV